MTYYWTPQHGLPHILTTLAHVFWKKHLSRKKILGMKASPTSKALIKFDKASPNVSILHRAVCNPKTCHVLQCTKIETNAPKSMRQTRITGSWQTILWALSSQVLHTGLQILLQRVVGMTKANVLPEPERFAAEDYSSLKILYTVIILHVQTQYESYSIDIGMLWYSMEQCFRNLSSLGYSDTVW